MSKEFNVIGIAVESIKNDNLTELDKALKIMPIEKLKDPNETLLTTFLSLCAGYNRPDALKMILERWKVVYPDNDKIPLLSRLFLKNTINNSTLSYIVSVHPDFTYVELIDDLAEFDASQEVMIACARANEIFGQQKHETYKILKEHANEFGNFVVEEYMVDKIAETAPYAKKPDYVKNYIGDYYPEYKDKLPTEKELYELADKESKDEIKEENFVMPSNEEAVEILTEGLSRYGISFVEIEKTKEFLLNEVSKSEERKKELLMPIMENQKQRNLETDRLLYWVFGGSNPLVDQNLTIDAPSYKYGGCRMFLCDLFDYNEEYDFVEDWFTGSCQQCLLRIKHRWYAVRKPRNMGGWEGCFCSWECVRKWEVEMEDFEMEEDLLTKKLIDIYEEKTNKVGIQDRIGD